MKRLFVAIPLDEKSKERLLIILKELEKLPFLGKIEPIEKIHLTLKFLGNTEENKIASINQILQNIADKFTPFIIKLKGFGFFPNNKNPRIFWISTEENSKIIFQLQKEIEDNLFKIGFPKENRDFKTHFTLMRIKSNKNLDKLLDKIQEFEQMNFEPMKVNCFNLYESILKPQGSEYKILKNFWLKIKSEK